MKLPSIKRPVPDQDYISIGTYTIGGIPITANIEKIERARNGSVTFQCNAPKGDKKVGKLGLIIRDAIVHPDGYNKAYSCKVRIPDGSAEFTIAPEGKDPVPQEILLDVLKELQEKITSPQQLEDRFHEYERNDAQSFTGWMDQVDGRRATESGKRLKPALDAAFNSLRDQGVYLTEEQIEKAREAAITADVKRSISY